MKLYFSPTVLSNYNVFIFFCFSRTSLEEDKLLEPSFVDSYISEVETIQQSESSLETPDVSNSHDVRQSVDQSTEQPSEEKIIEEEVDKRYMYRCP